MTELVNLFSSILTGDVNGARAAARQALSEGAAPFGMVTGCMIPAMDEVGRRFESEEYFVPELLLAGRAMKAALDIVRPLLAAAEASSSGRVVIGTVQGDLHDIGKNLVAMMLEGGGFEVFDLGTDVSPARFTEGVRSHEADLLCLSALLTTTMPAMKTTIEALEQSGVRTRVKVLVGGAPVTAAYARQIGADGYSENATQAVALARSLMSAGA